MFADPRNDENFLSGVEFEESELSYRAKFSSPLNKVCISDMYLIAEITRVGHDPGHPVQGFPYRSAEVARVLETRLRSHTRG